jgi:hypothetical protein
MKTCRYWLQSDKDDKFYPKSRYIDVTGLHNANGLFSIKYVDSFAMDTGYFLCDIRAEDKQKTHNLSITIEHGLLYKYR